MNLYKISQDDNQDYDTYDSAIVAADSAQEAQQIHPGTFSRLSSWDSSSWTSKPERVSVELIGTAVEGTRTGVILASFNAG